MTLGVNGYLYTLSSHTTPLNYLYNALYGLLYLFGGGIAIFYSTKFGIKSNLGKMLLFFGLGLWCYAAGLVVWVYYNFFLRVGIPFPSLADIFFVLFYPVMGLACYNLLRMYKPLINRAILRDSVLIAIISLLAVFLFFEKPDLSSHLGLIEKIINVLYPGGDTILVAMVLIALRIGGGKIHPSLYILLFGLTVQASADFLFVFRNANSTYWNGDISDLLYTCGGYIISFGLFEAIHNLNKTSPIVGSTSQQTPSTPVPANGGATPPVNS